jgi:hypothetical protein
MDRSLTYLDDVAAINVSLQLMQKRSVPLLRFTSTFEVHPVETLYTENRHTYIQAGDVKRM